MLMGINSIKEDGNHKALSKVLNYFLSIDLKANVKEIILKGSIFSNNNSTIVNPLRLN